MMGPTSKGSVRREKGKWRMRKRREENKLRGTKEGMGKWKWKGNGSRVPPRLQSYFDHC